MILEICVIYQTYLSIFLFILIFLYPKLFMQIRRYDQFCPFTESLSSCYNQTILQKNYFQKLIYVHYNYELILPHQQSLPWLASFQSFSKIHLVLYMNWLISRLTQCFIFFSLLTCISYPLLRHHKNFSYLCGILSLLLYGIYLKLSSNLITCFYHFHL